LSVKIGINGFGRIGRNYFRAALAKGSDLEIVAVNDLSDPAALAHLLKYDTVSGRIAATVEVDGDTIIVDGSSSSPPDASPRKPMRVCTSRLVPRRFSSPLPRPATALRPSFLV
jgi:hypothetical protein